MTETDEEVHSQTLGQANVWRILLKKGKKECRNQRGQGLHKKNLTETTN